MCTSELDAANKVERERSNPWDPSSPKCSSSTLASRSSSLNPIDCDVMCVCIQYIHMYINTSTLYTCKYNCVYIMYIYIYMYIFVYDQHATPPHMPPGRLLSRQSTHMGWLRLVGSLKLQVSFAEYRLFYRALSQKRPIILRSLLIVATPYLTFICIRYRNMYRNMSVLYKCMQKRINIWDGMQIYTYEYIMFLHTCL